ncbi:MAG: conserved membrane protein of unknown function [Candidatus Thorarchaeota archaeon]|nr:MAG: conserved membrane protein of unknown function [Candidatus Thorarchaeota archaeon]
MTDEVIDYTKHHWVTRISLVVIGIIIAAVIYVRITIPDLLTQLIIYLFAPMGVVMLSIGLGALSKRGIDYTPGSWESKKKWVTFKELWEIEEEYKDAYGHLTDTSDSYCGTCCCITPVIVLLFGFFGLFYTELILPLFDPLYDTVFVLLIEYILVALAGFISGFKSVSIDGEEFFKDPFNDDEVEYAYALSQVPGINAGVELEYGIRGDTKTILSAEAKAHLTDLPETVTIRVQVSHSGFAYPYLVGTVYKGSEVSEETYPYELRTRYPAMIETQMDDEVAVFVARFDIPKRSSSVPNISKSDFKELAILLERLLRDNYEHRNQ